VKSSARAPGAARDLPHPLRAATCAWKPCIGLGIAVAVGVPVGLVLGFAGVWIDLRDLPAPDDHLTPQTEGAGCPVPTTGHIGAVDYGTQPSSVMCPDCDTDISKNHRGEGVPTARFRTPNLEEQNALIALLKQL
jgi:hypothetical protein